MKSSSPALIFRSPINLTSYFKLLSIASKAARAFCKVASKSVFWVSLKLSKGAVFLKTSLMSSKASKASNVFSTSFSLISLHQLHLETVGSHILHHSPIFFSVFSRLFRSLVRKEGKSCNIRCVIMGLLEISYLLMRDEKTAEALVRLKLVHSVEIHLV